MVWLCLKIFFVRILDVSLGTFRTIVLIKGRNVLSGLIGFFEVLIWFLIVREALSSPEQNIWIAIFYSLGFAAGTIIGAFISDKLIKTNITLQVVTKSNKMASLLREKGYGVTEHEVQGKKGKGNMLLIGAVGTHYKRLLNLIRSIDDKAFIVVDEKKYVYNGYFLYK